MGVKYDEVMKREEEQRELLYGYWSNRITY